MRNERADYNALMTQIQSVIKKSGFKQSNEQHVEKTIYDREYKLGVNLYALPPLFRPLTLGLKNLI